MERLLLDTHAWLWLFNQEADRLAAPAVRRMEAAAARAELWVSTISVWELGLLDAKGRVVLNTSVEEWVAEALSKPGVRTASLDPSIALGANRLPGSCHGDPADRILIATARHLGAILATADRGIHAYAEPGYLKVLKL